MDAPKSLRLHHLAMVVGYVLVAIYMLAVAAIALWGAAHGAILPHTFTSPGE